MKSVENLENKGIKTLKIENVGFSAVSDVILRHFHLEKATNSSEKTTGQPSLFKMFQSAKKKRVKL